MFDMSLPSVTALVFRELLLKKDEKEIKHLSEALQGIIEKEVAMKYLSGVAFAYELCPEQLESICKTHTQQMFTDIVNMSNINKMEGNH